MLPKHQNKRNIAEKRNYHEPDYFLIFGIAAILVFGLVALSSATSVVSYAKTGSPYSILNHQLFGLLIAVPAFFIFSKIDYRIWKKYALYFLFFSIFLLVLVFIPGITGEWGTSRSWINVFGYSLQPSEFVKLSFLIYLAAWLEARKDELSKIGRGIVTFMIILGVISLLLLLQPDLGTLSILAATSLVVYYIGGGKVSHILAIIGVGIILLLIMLQLKPYQKDRFRCLIDPSYSANKTCYQINQSLIAVGSGGIMGRGLGESRQKYLYLPEVRGDSIFAVIAEEAGLIFSVVLIGAYVFIFYRGYLVAKRAPDYFGQNLAIGIVVWISFQAMINIGGIINLIPMTGVPLPLVSYGGSAVLAALSACGILVNISKQTTR